MIGGDYMTPAQIMSFRQIPKDVPMLKERIYEVLCDETIFETGSAYSSDTICNILYKHFCDKLQNVLAHTNVTRHDFNIIACRVLSNNSNRYRNKKRFKKGLKRDIGSARISPKKGAYGTSVYIFGITH